VGDNPPPSRGDAAGAGGEGAQHERGDHRHAEREDDRKRGPRGYDAGKKVKGRKRHVAVVTSGLALCVIVQHTDGARDLLRRLKRLYPWLRVVFADSVCDRLTALLACFLPGLTLLVIRRLAGAEGFVLLPRRWVAERTLGWFGRSCRLAKEDEELPEVSETHGQAGDDPAHAAPPRPPEPEAPIPALTSQTALSTMLSG
jgi:putative transposase